MRVLFDLTVCQPNRESKFHGGGVYGYIVFRNLVKIAPEKIVAYYSKSKFIEEDIEDIIIRQGIGAFDSDSVTLLEAYRQGNCSKIYTPLHNSHHDSAIEAGIPFIITIHGIRALEMFTDTEEINYARSVKDKVKAIVKQSPLGKLQYNKYYRKYNMLLAQPNVQIVTVSNHSKFSMRTFFPKSNIDNIRVFYSPSTTIDNYEYYKNTPTEKYYLIISANRWLKNAGRAIQALDFLFDNNLNLCDKVKVLGLKKDTKVYGRIRHKDKFEILGYQSQEDLERLYAGAYALIYPTLNEGFGYPPLEAMKYGTPVISSPFTSIPEICGDAVLYANPYDIHEIANRILQLEDKDTYRLYSYNGKKQYYSVFERQNKDLAELCKVILN